MLRRLRRLLAPGAESPVFRECRDCGTTVTQAVPHCPACGSSEIAAYDL